MPHERGIARIERSADTALDMWGDGLLIHYLIVPEMMATSHPEVNPLERWSGPVVNIILTDWSTGQPVSDFGARLPYPPRHDADIEEAVRLGVQRIRLDLEESAIQTAADRENISAPLFEGHCMYCGNLVMRRGTAKWATQYGRDECRYHPDGEGNGPHHVLDGGSRVE